MRIIENIFKSRFKNTKSLEGIDADELWGAIAEGIESTPVAASTQISMPKWAALLLFLCASGGLFYFYYNTIEHIEQQQVEVSNVAITSSQNTKVATKNALLAEEKKCNELEAIIPNQPLTALANNVGATVTTTENIDIEKRDFTSNSLHMKQEVFTQKTSKPIFENSIITVKENNQLQKNASIDFIKTLALSEIAIAKNEFNLPRKEVVLNPNIPVTPKRIPLEFAISTGVNTVFTSYRNTENKADLFNDLQKSSSNAIGFSTAVDVSYLVNEKYSISSGFSYEVIKSVFERTAAKEGTRLDAHYLLNYELNTTGDTINQVYGDKLLNTLATREVLHHNQFKLISLPLAIGVRKPFGRFDIGINAGFSYNFFLSQKGKSIDAQQEFYEFTDDTNSIRPFKKSFFAFQLNPFVDVDMTNKLKLRLSSTFKYQPQGVSGLYDVKQYSIFMGVSGGLVFRL